MIDLTSIPEDELSQTQRCIRQQVVDRGWRAEIPYLKSAHYFITRADGKKLHIFSSTPPTSSYASASLANDKFATYQLLELTDVPQLQTVKVGLGDTLDEAIVLLNEVGTVVVKPIDGGHGNGITINVRSIAELKVAIAIALPATKNVRAALVQKQYPYDNIYDLRILIIDYTFVAAIQRAAARVFGDGVHSVRELIELENATSRRGRAYHAQLATIDVKRAALHLNEKMDVIYGIGEEVQVIGVANYGAGGETIDVTDNIPDWLIEHSEVVARMCDLPVAGVDFMLACFPKRHMSKEDLDVAITEVNKAPLLTMHDTPTVGISRNVVAKYMDYLNSL